MTEPDFFLPDNIGHNKPPDMTETAIETMRSLSDWMEENPVIENEVKAREAKVFIDRGKLCIKDLEDERTGLVRPLNEQVAEINGHYKGPRQNLEKVLEEITYRISQFLRAEEARRIAIAEEARRVAAEAEERARAAEKAEQQALDDARSGELGVKVAARTEEADEAFKQFQLAERQAALADRESKVKIGGGFARAVSLRTETTLTVTDAAKAIKAIGVNEDINAAIIKAARAYKKLHDKYPPGIEVQTERKA